jgi:hypothetical protein
VQSLAWVLGRSDIHILITKLIKQTCFSKFGGSDDMIAKIILTTESHNHLSLLNAEGYGAADF